MVNSGRLSRPCTYPLTAPDADLPTATRPGAVAPDAPLGDGWLLEALGRDFVILALGQDAPAVPGARSLAPAVNDHLRRRYLGDQPQAIYLIRPDQVVAARWISAKADEITAAMKAAWGT
jgi:3-(3-hydroxy-phenyl)propionate hydroxylase